jgi:hypothetical protein
MMRRLLFPGIAFVTLVVVTLAVPSTARADPEACNDKVCTDLGTGIQGCLAAGGGPHTQCGDSDTSCIWDWCRIS